MRVGGGGGGGSVAVTMSMRNVEKMLSKCLVSPKPGSFGGESDGWRPPKGGGVRRERHLGGGPLVLQAQRSSSGWC